jgi:hypothetical protein
MKFYVSLVQDLIGCYLEYEADDELTVRKYLDKKYRRETEDGRSIWTLPWCSVYPEIPEVDREKAIIIKVHGGKLHGY